MTSEQATQVAISLLACIWIGDFVRGLFQKRKVKADSNLSDANATKVIVGTATELLKPLSARVKEAEKEARELRQELRDARNDATQCRQEVSSARIEVSKLVTQLQECTAENKRVTIENRKLRARLA